jgi:hypothetical protein
LAGTTVGGSVRGGPGGESGSILGDGLGVVTVRGDLIGGTGIGAGCVFSDADLATATIGGSVRGGSQLETGAIIATGAAGAIAIGGDVVGGSASGTVGLAASGYIEAKRIARLSLNGSLIAGTDLTSGAFAHNGAICVDDDIGTVLIKGSLIGNPTNPALISARGSATPTTTGDVAIGRLTVLGRAEFANILAGVSPGTGGSVPADADAQIGVVTVGGDWIASSLVAGAVAGGDGYFGDADDARMAGSGVKDDPLLVSSIARLSVGGQVVGTIAAGDYFGIVAEAIGAVTIHGSALPLVAGPHNDDLSLGPTADFSVHELPGP